MNMKITCITFFVFCVLCFWFFFFNLNSGHFDVFQIMAT
jgi:hypothetical protein